MSVRALVLIPSYDTGPILARTVREACAAWPEVCVVLDGSRDGSAERLAGLAQSGLRVLVRAVNGGKGAAVLDGLRDAARRGFTHALVMDADGQHPAGEIARFMAASRAAPEAMILGQPRFGPEAPLARVLGRRLSNACVALETLRAGVGDSLFGFRVYPVAPLLAAMEGRRSMRRYDFDAEAAVRLVWGGVPARRLDAPVRYVPRAEGGVSHFRYGRDNLLLARMHLRLLAGLAWRWPRLLARGWRYRAGRPSVRA